VVHRIQITHNCIESFRLIKIQYPMPQQQQSAFFRLLIASSKTRLIYNSSQNIFFFHRRFFWALFFIVIKSFINKIFFFGRWWSISDFTGFQSLRCWGNMVSNILSRLLSISWGPSWDLWLGGFLAECPTIEFSNEFLPLPAQPRIFLRAPKINSLPKTFHQN
jgi:hypothetical protein